MVETVPHRKQGLVYPPYSMPLLLISWRKGPGHHISESVNKSPGSVWYLANTLETFKHRNQTQPLQWRHMNTKTSHITHNSTIYSTTFSGWQKKKSSKRHITSPLRWGTSFDVMDSLNKWPMIRKWFPCHNVCHLMSQTNRMVTHAINVIGFANGHSLVSIACKEKIKNKNGD